MRRGGGNGLLQQRAQMLESPGHHVILPAASSMSSRALAIDAPDVHVSHMSPSCLSLQGQEWGESRFHQVAQGVKERLKQVVQMVEVKESWGGLWVQIRGLDDALSASQQRMTLRFKHTEDRLGKLEGRLAFLQQQSISSYLKGFSGLPGHMSGTVVGGGPAVPARKRTQVVDVEGSVQVATSQLSAPLDAQAAVTAAASPQRGRRDQTPPSPRRAPKSVVLAVNANAAGGEEKKSVRELFKELRHHSLLISSSLPQPRPIVSLVEEDMDQDAGRDKAMRERGSEAGPAGLARKRMAAFGQPPSPISSQTRDLILKFGLSPSKVSHRSTSESPTKSWASSSPRGSSSPMQSEKPSSPSNSNSHIKSPQAKSPIKSPNEVAQPGPGRGEEGLEWTKDDKEGSGVYAEDFEDIEENLDGEESEEEQEVKSGWSGPALVDLRAPVRLSAIQPSPPTPYSFEPSSAGGRGEDGAGGGVYMSTYINTPPGRSERRIVSSKEGSIEASKESGANRAVAVTKGWGLQNSWSSDGSTPEVFVLVSSV